MCNVQIGLYLADNKPLFPLHTENLAELERITRTKQRTDNLPAIQLKKQTNPISMNRLAAFANSGKKKKVTCYSRPLPTIL